MILILDIERLRTLDEMLAFLEVSDPVDFHPQTRQEAYAFAQHMLSRFDHTGLHKPD